MKKISFKHLFIFLIRCYRFFISPFFPSCCRFNPTCSSFAMTTLDKYGLFRGGWLSLKRILHCHPLSHHSSHYPLP